MEVFKMKAIFTKHSANIPGKITEDNELFYELQEHSDATQAEAKKSGHGFLHLYELESNDNDQEIYRFVTTIAI